MELHDRAGGLGGLREGFTEVYVQYNICDFLSSTDFPQSTAIFGRSRLVAGKGRSVRLENVSRLEGHLAALDVLG
jgi:hypothetical protein